MTPAKLIHRFNLINGNALSLATAKELHGQVQKAIDHDSHGPYAKPLREVYNKLATFMKKLSAQNATGAARVEFEKVEYHPGIGIRDIARLGKVKSSKLKVESVDDGLLNGLECIQNDSEYQGKELGAIGDTTYKVITDKILSLIEKDGLIWRKPWNESHPGKESHAHNYVTKHYYRGANYYLNYLLLSEFSHPYFFTFRQVEQKGGKVKAGAKGWPVIYFKYLYKKINGGLVDEAEAMNGNKLKEGYERFPALFYYTVFNYEQTEGIKVKAFKPVKISLKEKIESCERIVATMPKKPDIQNKRGDDAYYRPSTDSITMPLMEQFKVEQQYYSVLFHELIHSTGAQHRVGRDMGGRFGTKSYAFEELIAELGASFLCGESGILYHTLDNSAAYIKNWSQKLREEMTADPKFFLKAAAAAEKATEFILSGKAESVKVKSEKPKSVKPKAESNKLRKPAKKVERVKLKVESELSGKPETGNRKPATKKPVTRNPQPATSLHGIVDATTLAGVNFRTFELQEPYKTDFHKINSDTQIMLWGSPGHGKTVYALKFAQYVAEVLGLNTLYIAHEEFGRSTFSEKLRQHNIGHANLKFTATLNQTQIDQFDAIFFDSINSLEMTLADYRRLVKAHPGKLYVLIVQSTKDGDFRGGNNWEHEVDVAGEIRNRKLILHKNRFDPHNPEKMEQLLTNDAIAEAKKKAHIRQAVKESNKPQPQPVIV